MRGGGLWLVTLAVVWGCKSADSGVTPQGATTPGPTEAGSGGASSMKRRAPDAGSTAAARASSSAAAPEEPEPKQAYRIAAVGDSLTDAKSFGGGYLAYVQRRCPETRIDNFAKGGHMLNQIRREFEARVHNQPRGTYSHVIVWGGVNDLYSDLTAGRTPQKAASDLAIIYEKARSKGAKLVALTVSPWGGFKRYHNPRRQAYTLELNGWIKEQLEAGKVDHVVDAYALLSCGAEERLCPAYQQRTPDGLHLGKQGHEVLGKALFEAVFQNCR